MENRKKEMCVGMVVRFLRGNRVFGGVIRSIKEKESEKERVFTIERKPVGWGLECECYEVFESDILEGVL